MKHSYRVTWTIDVEARSEVAAARVAREIQLDPANIADVFKVRLLGSSRPAHLVDLQQENEKEKEL